MGTISEFNEMIHEMNEDYNEQRKEREVRVFVSMPMADKSDEYILEKFENIEKQLEVYFGNKKVVIVHGFRKRKSPRKPDALYSMSKSIGMLSTADRIYMAKGWEDARGCRIEHQCAKEYGIPIIYAV